MKIRLLLLALLCMCAQSVLALTAEDYILQGRNFLGATNINSANNSFSNALALSANHQTANVFYATTRLLALPTQSAGSNFLNQLGLPVPGRDLYHWTASFPTDSKGALLAPAGVNAKETVAYLRTNVLTALMAAETNLAKVTLTNFTITLSTNETRSSSVTLDYGDIVMFRAFIQASEYFIYTTYSWNIDAQLSAIRSLYTNNQLNIEKMLTDYPSLLTFSTTNDLIAAKLAFKNGVDRYNEASLFIRNRATNVTRLFNYDAGMASDEQKFRQTLVDLTNSFTKSVVMTSSTNYTIFLGSHFSGTHTPRSFLPIFKGKGFVLTTLPDSTLGGLVFGLSGSSIEEFLGNHFSPIPSVTKSFSALNGRFTFPMNVAKGHGYVIQASTNLVDWWDHTAFISDDWGYHFTEQNIFGQPRRFYRLIDKTGHLPPPSNDIFANRTTIPGLNSSVSSYTQGASQEFSEPYVSGNPHTVWWTWTASGSFDVAVAASGGDNGWYINVYTGNSVDALSYVAGGANSVPFQAVAGTTYQICINSYRSDTGVKLVISRPPVLNVSSPLQDATFYPPANIVIAASASDPDGQIKKLQVTGEYNFTATGSSFSTTWTNVPLGTHYFNFLTTDDAGVTSSDYRSIRVRPSNDDFLSATVINGAPLTLAITNLGAAEEPAEPPHGGGFGNSSIWYSWKATVSGIHSMEATITNRYFYGRTLINVYTGSTLPTLVSQGGGMSMFDSTARESFMATAGQTYKIAVDTEYGQGSGTLKIIKSAAPTIAITNIVNSSTYYVPTNLLVSAKASDSDGTIARVDFYADGSLIGSKVTAPYSIIWTNLTAFNYTRQLSAFAVDNSGLGTWSDAIYVTFTQPPPPNDNFAQRTLVTGTNITVTGSNGGATSEGSEPGTFNSTIGQSIWWKWKAPKSGQVTIKSTGSSFNTVLAVYTGSSIDLLTELFDSVNGPSVFTAVAGTEYQIKVDSYYDFFTGYGTGNITLTINES